MMTMILAYQVNFVAIIWEEESNLSAMNLFFCLTMDWELKQLECVIAFDNRTQTLQYRHTKSSQPIVHMDFLQWTKIEYYILTIIIIII